MVSKVITLAYATSKCLNVRLKHNDRQEDEEEEDVDKHHDEHEGENERNINFTERRSKLASEKEEIV